MLRLCYTEESMTFKEENHQVYQHIINATNDGTYQKVRSH